MQPIHAQLMGIELYFDNLEKATKFIKTRSAFRSQNSRRAIMRNSSAVRFICLERKGVESYPSKDKAVLFFAVANVESAVAAIGRERFVHVESAWAVLHDPEGHNVLLVQSAEQSK